ncbi:MAG: hypothetical protein IPJ65_08855 [Archangiaceae bacterium]|nr:hypothetical protein [Archangiaceae bacterium]
MSLTIPGAWSDDSAPDRKLNEQAVLQASNRGSELYVIVLSQSKEELADMDLKKFSDETRATQMQAMKNAVEEGPRPRTVGGMNAIEYVLKGTVDKASIVMKHVAVDGGKRYHQVLVWTLQSSWDNEKVGLDQVIESLKESAPAAAARAPAP